MEISDFKQQKLLELKKINKELHELRKNLLVKYINEGAEIIKEKDSSYEEKVTIITRIIDLLNNIDKDIELLMADLKENN